MMLNASQDYALRMCAHLARKGSTASSKEIAEATGVPRDYLIQIAQLLRNAGIVESSPGKHGGYRLAKGPADTSVLGIVTAVDGRERKGEVGDACFAVEDRMSLVLSGMTLDEVAL